MRDENEPMNLYTCFTIYDMSGAYTPDHMWIHVVKRFCVAHFVGCTLERVAILVSYKSAYWNEFYVQDGCQNRLHATKVFGHPFFRLQHLNVTGQSSDVTLRGL